MTNNDHATLHILTVYAALKRSYQNRIYLAQIVSFVSKNNILTQ